MFGSGVIDTAIGLIFVFLLISMLVTIANELISAVFLSRSKWLGVGIVQLLDSEWAHKLYAHPLIEGSAVVANSTPLGSWWKGLRGGGPSYIPSRSFANVLVHLLHDGDDTLKVAKSGLQAALDAACLAGANLDALKAAATTSLRQPQDALARAAADLDRLLAKPSTLGPELSSWPDDLRGVAAKLDDPSVRLVQDALTALAKDCQGDLAVDEVRKHLQSASALIPYVGIAEAVKKDLGALLVRLPAGSTVGDAKADIQRFIDTMPLRYARDVIARVGNDKVRKTLLVLFDDAEGDVEKFKQNIEIWFNNAMDRVGGWYKRRSQWVIGGLGVLVAVGMNVDAVLIVKHLETHPGERDALVAQAKAYADKAPAPVPKPADAASAPTELPPQFKQVQAELKQLGLPIGWVRRTASAPMQSEIDNRQVLPDASTLVDTVAFHLWGWIITTLAATLGAPFWFDTLNRVISIRSAGKAPEEKPKPPKDVPTPLEPGQSPQEADAANAGKR